MAEEGPNGPADGAAPSGTVAMENAPGKILVGVDGSANSAAALRWAVAEAELRRSPRGLPLADDSLEKHARAELPG